MSTVLVPFDGSQQSRDALEFACEKFSADELTVLYVVDTSITHQPEQYTGMKLSEIYDQREREGENHLDEADAIASTFGTSITTVMERGEPARTILKQIEKQNADHVVMGSQRTGRLERYFLGSVAERIVVRTDASVTVIRS